MFQQYFQTPETTENNISEKYKTQIHSPQRVEWSRFKVETREPEVVYSERWFNTLWRLETEISNILPDRTRCLKLSHTLSYVYQSSGAKTIRSTDESS